MKSSDPRNTHPWRLLAALLLLTISVNACGSDDSLTWTEDVLLPDGRTITLTRYEEFKGWAEPGHPPTGSDHC
jgi:hypothetical protein